MTCKDCIHYCICKDTVADENWDSKKLDKEVREYIKDIFSPSGCENFENKADYIKVKYGEWIDCRIIRDIDSITEWQCSSCSEWSIWNIEDGSGLCPKCGAVMGKNNGKYKCRT